MPRKREHDPDHVLLGLVSAFREGGYEGTSFSDLEAATGLDRAQLSRLYGDKRTLFLSALDRFIDIGISTYLEPLADAGRLDDIRSLLLIPSKLHGSEEGRLGCLVSNTCREPIATDDPDVQALIQKHWRRLEGAFASALRNSVAAGDLDMSDTEIRRTARLFYGVHVSLMVLVRAGESKSVLRDIALRAFESID
ncbi:MAG: TetR/AcrR family transcriptional regulator [Planctomycetota bacterium]